MFFCPQTPQAEVSEDQQYLGPMIAGAVAGAASSLIRVPTEVVKQRLQTGEFKSAVTAVGVGGRWQRPNGERGFVLGEERCLPSTCELTGWGLEVGGSRVAALPTGQPWAWGLVLVRPGVRGPGCAGAVLTVRTCQTPLNPFPPRAPANFPFPPVQ